MKLSLLGLLAIFSVACATVMPYYPMYGAAYNNRNSGFSGFGEGGLFEMIIFLFVFILIIQVLFGGLYGGNFGGGGGYGGGKGGSAYGHNSGVDYK